ncbi:MAG: DUF883 family protein [Opitutales bacterium]|nr:DUF883 family protein [Opitutales bacterium]
MRAKIKSNSGSVKKSRDQLVEDFKRVIEDFQGLTEESKNASGAAIHKGLDTVHEYIEDGKHAIDEAGDKIAAGAGRYAESMGKSISNNPWRSVAIAAVAGLLLDRFLPR